MKGSKFIVCLLILVQLVGFIPNIDINYNISAIDMIYETTELNPKFSALDIDINDSLIISYEDIDTSDYECSLSASGISASIIEGSDYLQCEIEAVDGVEFGELTVSAISPDGTELRSTIYTFNNGERLYYSEFAKDQAWYEGGKEWIEKAIEGVADCFTYRHWEEEYSQLMSTILSGNPIVTSHNNSIMKISGNIEWEINDTHSKLPLKSAYVEIVVKNDYKYEILASDYTDENGRYDLQISKSSFEQNSDIYIRINLEAHTFKVRSGWHTFPYYFDQRLSDVISAGDNVTSNLCITYDDSMKIYKATHVHQSMVIAERFAAEMGFQSDTKIRVAYPAGIELNKEDWALSQSGFCWGETDGDKYCAIGWNKYDDVNTVVHEYSHYIQCSMGNYDTNLGEIICENPKHKPNIDQYAEKENKKFAMHLTWTEGWGYVFAVMAQRYYDSEYFGLSNYKTDITLNGVYMGEFQENSVTDFLWSLIDKEKVDSQIDNSTENLDYEFPLTAQEWWNITTVQGTYRLHDFMKLIDEELYDLGVDLDYKSAKKYIAEKLTKFNIAPKIISVVPDSPNASPIIKWNPNGSPTYENGEYYANNKFYVKVFDENLNLLYTSEPIDTNVSNNAECEFSIPQESWNQIIAGKDCLTVFYISVEGYRYDSSADDIVKESGPYYSEYYTYKLNTCHDCEYIYLNEYVHEYICRTCNIDIEVEHIWKHSSSGNSITHKSNCLDCKKIEDFNHNFIYYEVDNIKHHKKCDDCGYSISENHTIVKTGNTSNTHTFACTKCSYTVTEYHNFEYTSTSSTRHSQLCTDCGYNSNSDHRWKYKVYGTTSHQKYCMDCQYVYCTEKHLADPTYIDPTGKYNKCRYCNALYMSIGFEPIIKTKKEIEEETE